MSFSKAVRKSFRLNSKRLYHRMASMIRNVCRKLFVVLELSTNFKALDLNERTILMTFNAGMHCFWKQFIPSNGLIKFVKLDETFAQMPQRTRCLRRDQLFECSSNQSQSRWRLRNEPTFTFDEEQVLGIHCLESSRQICSVDEVLRFVEFRHPTGDVIELNEDARCARSEAKVTLCALVVDHSDVEQTDRLLLGWRSRQAVGHVAGHQRNFGPVIVDRLLQLFDEIGPNPALERHMTVAEVNQVLRAVRLRN